MATENETARRAYENETPQSGYVNGKTRGIRNCNPLNIRKGSAAWKGLLPEEEQTDKEFCRFISMAYGFRAAFVLLNNYITKHGCNTIESIISRWAPPKENNTEAYIRRVCIDTMYGGKEVICARSPMLKDIAWAMAKVECGSGILAYEEDLEKGWGMAFG